MIEPRLLFSRPLVDAVPRPRSEVETPRKVPRLSDLSDWEQLGAMLLGDVGGKQLLDYDDGTDSRGFPRESFDRVRGTAVLQRLGPEVALAEVWRVLKPGGIAVFLERIGDPGRGEIVTWKEIAMATRGYTRAFVCPYHLVSRFERFMPRRAEPVARRLDHALLTVAPWLRRFAGAAVIQVVK